MSNEARPPLDTQFMQQLGMVLHEQLSKHAGCQVDFVLVVSCGPQPSGQTITNNAPASATAMLLEGAGSMWRMTMEDAHGNEAARAQAAPWVGPVQ